MHEQCVGLHRSFGQQFDNEKSARVKAAIGHAVDTSCEFELLLLFKRTGPVNKVELRSQVLKVIGASDGSCSAGKLPSSVDKRLAAKSLQAMQMR